MGRSLKNMPGLAPRESGDQATWERSFSAAASSCSLAGSSLPRYRGFLALDVGSREASNGGHPGALLQRRLLVLYPNPDFVNITGRSIKRCLSWPRRKLVMEATWERSFSAAASSCGSAAGLSLHNTGGSVLWT